MYSSREKEKMFFCVGSVKFHPISVSIFLLSVFLLKKRVFDPSLVITKFMSGNALRE